MMMSHDFADRLPASLAGLVPLARNLRWSWHRPGRELFERIDPGLWRATRHNPVQMLAQLSPERAAELAADASFLRALEEVAEEQRRYLSSDGSWWSREGLADPSMRVAYFSAEFAITECLPISSGGLGVLAGDHLKSASDLGIPLVAVGLFYHEGYFTQEVGADGRQRDAYLRVEPTELPLTLETDGLGQPLVVTMPMLDRRLHAQVWRADVGRIPLYLLDTDIPQNRPEDRHITDRLYGGDVEHRLRQEIVLGIGGMRALEALGREPTVVHLNEGHAAFAAVERARQLGGDGGGFREAAERNQGGVVFTTHTPVPAGHDYFAPDLLERYLGGYVWEMRGAWDHFLSLGRRDGAWPDEPFCMTILALRMAAHRNGVSRLHGEVSREMWRHLWPGVPTEEVPIGHITNGVHLPTWVSSQMAALYARHLGDAWRDETDEVRWQRAAHIPLEELWAVRSHRRKRLVEEARKRLRRQMERLGEEASWTDTALDPSRLTIVFARRFATYKRAVLLLSQPERLERLLATGRVQFVFAGKAHPKDQPGQDMIQQVVAFALRPEHRDRFVFLEDYDVELARRLVSGADVWLNVPRRPHEASGTSGMKAAANGALNLSIPDGWWAEAWTDHNACASEPVGWSIQAVPGLATDADDADAEALFRLLEREVLPLFGEVNDEGLPVRWLERVRSAVRQLAPVYSTHRMVRDYVEGMYVPAHHDSAALAAATARAAEA
ncbi:MAG TPA: alpha-glucan family phosphorylase [Longimicrobiales bacterium]|nr:alpha-glucan family phosphorylase [Longimicrobiales bacterium]